MRTMPFAIKIILGATLLGLIGACNFFKGGAKEGDTVIVIKQPEGDTLATVGRTKLTVEELRDDFLRRQGSFRGAPNLNTEKARSDYLEGQLNQEAMFQKAVALGYFDRLEVKQEIKKIIVQRLVRDMLEELQSKYVPTDEQMLDHYNKNKNFYNRADAIKVAFISIPFGSDKAKSKALAEVMHKDALASVKNNNTREFSRLALKHASSNVAKVSIETNETDFLDKAAFEAKFGANLFDTVKDQNNIGDIRGLIATENAHVILMKTGFRKALSETFDDAKPKIAKRLAYENRNEFYKKFVEDLRVEFKITINNEKVALLSKDDPKNQVAKNDPTKGPGAPPTDKSHTPQPNTTAGTVSPKQAVAGNNSDEEKAKLGE